MDSSNFLTALDAQRAVTQSLSSIKSSGNLSSSQQAAFESALRGMQRGILDGKQPREEIAGLTAGGIQNLIDSVHTEISQKTDVISNTNLFDRGREIGQNAGNPQNTLSLFTNSSFNAPKTSTAGIPQTIESPPPQSRTQPTDGFTVNDQGQPVAPKADPNQKMPTPSDSETFVKKFTEQEEANKNPTTELSKSWRSNQKMIGGGEILLGAGGAIMSAKQFMKGSKELETMKLEGKQVGFFDRAVKQGAPLAGTIGSLAVATDGVRRAMGNDGFIKFLNSAKDVAHSASR